MAFSKAPKAQDYTLAENIVTIKDLTDMSVFIRNFKLKYSSKKTGLNKKKK